MDTCFIASKPTEKELRTLEKLIRQQIGKREPNLCLSVYKNRGGIYNQIKIWLDVDYNTMRTEDLFVTDYNYQKIDMIKTYTCVDEDKVVVKTNKEDIKKVMMARQRMAMIEAEIEEDNEEEEIKSEEENDEVNDEENDEVNDEENDEMNDEMNDEVSGEMSVGVNDEVNDETSDEIQEDVTPEPEELPQEKLMQNEPLLVENAPSMEPQTFPKIIQDKTEDQDFEFKMDRRFIPVDRSKNIIGMKSINSKV